MHMQVCTHTHIFRIWHRNIFWSESSEALCFMEPVLSMLHTVPRADCLLFHFIFPKFYVVGLLYYFAEGLIESYGTSGCLSPELMSALGKLYQWLTFHNSDFFFWWFDVVFVQTFKQWKLVTQNQRQTIWSIGQTWVRQSCTLLGSECGSQPEGSSMAEGMLELQRGHNPDQYLTSRNDTEASQSPTESLLRDTEPLLWPPGSFKRPA